MANYKVKSQIQHGEKNTDTGEHEILTYPPGSSIELDEKQAYELRHALVDGPRDVPKQVAEAEGFEELDEEEQAAIESIRNRPDNADSGVLLHWKTDQLARDIAEGQALQASGTIPVGRGFDRANAGLTPDYGGLTGSAAPRPEANKTVMEREDEKVRMEAEKKLREANERRVKPQSTEPTRSTPAVAPGVPGQQVQQPPKAADKK